MNKNLLLLLLVLLLVSTSALFGQVAPMIQSEWNTISPWNGACPRIGYTRADAGTGALSVAKIMKYWNYPAAGVGNVSYVDDDLGQINQSLAVGFDWERMANNLYRPETGILIRTVAYGIESDWELDYTTSSIENVMASMLNNFSYSSSMEYHALAETSFYQWRQMINEQLSLGRPVLYQGYAADVDRNYFIVIDGLTVDNRYTYLTSLGGYEHYTTNLTDLNIDGHAISVNNQKMLINIIPQNVDEYDESFEDGFTNNNWYFQGNAGWTISSNEAYAGIRSARPQNIAHNQSSSILIDLAVPETDNISFYIKPSCETPTEGQCDRAVFYINGVEQDEWNGIGDWTFASYTLQPGTYQFKWSYIKDGSVIHGDDTVYLDAISLPSGETPLHPPLNLTAEVNADNTVVLNWDYPEGYQRDLQGYKIYKDGSELAQSFNPGITTYTNGNVANGLHNYAIKAIYNNGLSNYSNTAFVEIEIMYPPTNMQYSMITPGTAWIRWEASPLAGTYTPDSYKLYVNNAWHSDTVQNEIMLPLEEGEHLFYATAVYDGIESSPSTVLHIVVGTLPPPSNLTATVYAGNNVHLEWTLPVTPSITGYEIYRNSQLLTTINNLTATAYNDEELSNGNYVYTIKTKNGNETSGPSLAASVVIMTLLSPINVQSTIVNDVSVQLTWSYPSMANLLDQYKVYRDGVVVASVYNTANPNFFDYNLANGNYDYQVTALYNGVESEFSETESVEINYPYPPRDFIAIANGSNVQLTWSIPATQGGRSRSLQGYEIYQDGELLTNLANISMTSHVVNDVENGTYTFAIAAEYDSGMSMFVEAQVTVEVLYAPQNLAYSLDGNNATITWEAGSLFRDLIQYRLYRNGIEHAITAEPIYEDMNLSNGYYEYSVVAEYSEGLSEYSETIFFDLEFPYPVSSLEYEIEDNNIILTWETPSDTGDERSLVSYELFRNDTSLITTTSLTYTDFNLINGSYDYYIVVHYTNESSEPSNPVSVELIKQYPIENLTWLVQERNNIVLTWDINSYSGETIENFAVLRNGDPLTTISELTYSDLALEDGEYTYSIIATYNNGAAETIIGETIQIEYPYPVSQLAVTVSDDNVDLTWEYQGTESTIFKIFRNSILINETSELNYNDGNLANGSYDYYIITANDSDSGDSIASATVNAEVSVTYPVTGLVANVIGDSIALTWNAPAISGRAFVSYKLFVNDELFQENITTTQHTLTGLPNGAYAIFVVATYTNGDSVPSNIVNALLEVKYTPINFTIDTSGNNVELNWEAPTDATGILNYNIYRNSEVVAQVVTPTYADNDLVNNNYSYAITSNYESGESLPTAIETTLIDLIYPVINLTAQAVNADFSVTWEINPLAGASIVEYQIFRDGVLTNTTDGIGFQANSNANGTYETAVKAVYGSGVSELSEAVTAVIDVHYQVNNLAYSIEDNNVTLTWQAHEYANNVIEYVVYRDNEELATVSDLSYTDTNLANGSYAYQVKAIYLNGESDFSDSVEAIIELLYAPNNLAFSAVANSITLNWEEPNAMYRGFIGYKLFRDEELLVSLTELTYIDSDLTNGNYTYSVKAEYSSGDSEASNAVIANVEVLYPAVNLALDIVADDVTLTWETNLMSGASIIDYTIYRDGQSIGNIAELNYLDEALANGIYEYSVAVNYLTGSSILAQAVSGLVEVLYPPQNLSCLVEANNVFITWDVAPTSATRSFLGYNLYRDDELIFFTETATAYNDLNLINNSYEYKLEAEYSTGTSEDLFASVLVEVLYPVVNFTGSLTDTEISLAWENNPLAGSSVISYSLFRNSELYVTQTELSYLDVELANGVYEYSVVANYNSGSASASADLIFNLEITYPATNLTAQVTADVVDLAWELPATSPRSLLSYNIYRDGVVIANTEELNYSDTALRNAVYSYFVTAEYTSGESDPSNSVTAIVEVLYAPNNLTFNVVEDSITLNWEEPNAMYRGFIGYKVFRDEELLTSLTELTYTDNDLINGNYTYSVKAEYSSGDSEASNEVTANVEVLYPAFNLALDIVEDDVTLTWETNLMSGASIIDFTIYRDGQSIGNIAELNYLDEALANGIYEYSVAVNYLTGTSELAQAVSGLVEVLYPPQNLNCVVEANNVLITWDVAPTSATRSFLGYRLYRDNEEIFFDETATAYNDLNLINNSYEYKLEAEYSTGTSEALTALVNIEVLYPVENFTGSLTDTEISLAWENNLLAGSSVISYELFRNSELYATQTELSYLDVELANGVYEYSVVANYNSGSAIASETLTFNLEVTYPVTNLTAEVTGNIVDLAWDLPVNSPRALLSFNIYRDGVVVGNTEELNYSDTALTNATYSYFVTAEYTSGESDPSNSVEAIVEVLYAPNNLTFSVVENSITLNWEEPNAMYRNFIGYKLFRDEELLASLTELTFTDDGLTNGDYTYSVKAEYSSGDSEASNAVTANVEVLYPANNLTGTLNNDEVTLAWDTPSELYRNFLGYNVYRNNELIDSTLETSFVDSFLANGSHAYYIKTNYTTGESTPTNSVEFLVEITYPVTSLSASLDENNVTLTWDIPAISAQTRAFRGYFIYRNNAIATVIENPATTSWIDNSLANGDYDYYLKAVYDAGISVESNHVVVNIEILPDLFAPANLQLMVENIRNVHLTWDIPSAEVSNYLIFKDNLEFATSTSNSYWDNNLSNGSYHYYVKAVYPEGISSPSNSVVANIASTDTPNNLEATITNENDVVLTWEVPNNSETAFIINRNGEELIYISDVIQNEYIDQNLTNALYTYTIRAVYNHQFSELSNPAYADVMKLYTPQISYYQAIDNYVSFTWEDLTPWGRLVDYTVYKNGEEVTNTTASSYTEADLTNGNYDFTVSSNFDFGSSEQSTPVSFDILMPQMVTNVATTITNNDLVLSWDYPVDTGLISAYKVYRDGVVIATTQDNSFTDVDLVNGDYSYQIMTYYNDTVDNPITEALAVAYIKAYPITNLSTDIVGEDIVLTWDAPLDMYGFIHYEVSRNAEFVMNILGTENEFIDIAPENGLYQYTIKSVYQNDAEVEVVSESVNFIIPVSPTNLAISAEETVSLTWNFTGTDYGFTGFEVYNDDELLTTTTATTYELDLDNGNYNFKISTSYGPVASEYSDVLSYELVKTYPVLNATAELTDNDLELSWDSPADTYGLNSITIIRTLSDEGRLEVVLAATATSYLDEGISNGIYNYDIVANYGSTIQDDKIVSINDISIITALPATNLAVAATGNDLLLSWNEPIDIFGFSIYEVYQNNVLVGTTENSEYALADQANGDYTFKVKSIYTQDNEIFSESLEYTLIIAYPALNTSLEFVDNDLVIGWTNPTDTFGLDNFTLLNNDTVIGQTDSEGFVITNAANGVYNLIVRANYSNDTSTEVVIATDFVKLVPHQVGSVSVAVNSGIPQISWTAHTDLFGLVGYNVYSMTDDVVDQPELWTTIDTLITDSSIIDDVTELVTGNYQWAVVTVYRDPISNISKYSEAKLSDVLTDNNDQDVVAITSITGNYPNPFNPETQISFQIAKDSYVSMNVYNIKGQLVKSLVNENMKSGSHTITWHGKDNSGRLASSGVYFFRLSNNGVSKVHKCTLMK